MRLEVRRRFAAKKWSLAVCCTTSACSRSKPCVVRHRREHVGVQARCPRGSPRRNTSGWRRSPGRPGGRRCCPPCRTPRARAGPAASGPSGRAPATPVVQITSRSAETSIVPKPRASPSTITFTPESITAIHWLLFGSGNHSYWREASPRKKARGRRHTGGGRTAAPAALSGGVTTAAGRNVAGGPGGTDAVNCTG